MRFACVPIECRRVRPGHDGHALSSWSQGDSVNTAWLSPAPVCSSAYRLTPHNRIGTALTLLPCVSMQSAAPAAISLAEAQAFAAEIVQKYAALQRAQQPLQPPRQEAGATGPAAFTAVGGTAEGNPVPKKRGRPRKHPLPADPAVIVPGHAGGVPGPPGQQQSAQQHGGSASPGEHLDTQPAPKKRGRPRKHPLPDPNQPAEAGVKRPRGRPPGVELGTAAAPSSRSSSRWMLRLEPARALR